MGEGRGNVYSRSFTVFAVSNFVCVFPHHKAWHFSFYELVALTAHVLLPKNFLSILYKTKIVFALILKARLCLASAGTAQDLDAWQESTKRLRLSLLLVRDKFVTQGLITVTKVRTVTASSFTTWLCALFWRFNWRFSLNLRLTTKPRLKESFLLGRVHKLHNSRTNLRTLEPTRKILHVKRMKDITLANV